MLLGASTHMLRERPLGRDLLADVRAAGIESVELSDYHLGFDYDDASSIERIRDALLDLSLHLNSFHVHLAQLRDEYRPGSPNRIVRPGPTGKFDPECDLATTNAQRRRSTLVAYRKAVDVLEALGGAILVMHDIMIPDPGSESDGPDPADRHDVRRAAFLDNLGDVARYAAPKGVRIAVENTSGGYTSEPERLLALIRDLSEPNVGIVIDTGHRNRIGDPAAAIDVVAEHLIALHINDNSGQADEHLLPGEGSIQWEGVMQGLTRGGYAGVFMYELSRPADLSRIRPNFERLMDTRASTGD